jgi:hypothetical protein
MTEEREMFWTVCPSFYIKRKFKYRVMKNENQALDDVGCHDGRMD